MAKALTGYMAQTSREAMVLGAENAKLRGRIGDLEALVASLQAENDALVAAHAAALDESLHDFATA